jgi:hypothetical protein
VSWTGKYLRRLLNEYDEYRDIESGKTNLVGEVSL